MSYFLSKLSKREILEHINYLLETNSGVRKYFDKISAPKNKSTFVQKDYNSCRRLIKNEYFPKYGDDIGGANQDKISQCIKTYYQNYHELESSIELFLFSVELGVKYTNEYGDIDETFYDGVANSFHNALEFMKTSGNNSKYRNRCRKLVEDTTGIGWGFHDELHNLYYKYFKE